MTADAAFRKSEPEPRIGHHRGRLDSKEIEEGQVRLAIIQKHGGQVERHFWQLRLQRKQVPLRRGNGQQGLK